MTEQKMQIKASDDLLKGAYANAMQVAHTKEEFIIDFFSLMPPQGQLTARVITSPGHAKRILSALTENLKKYESQFGLVTEAEAPQKGFGF